MRTLVVMLVAMTAMACVTVPKVPTTLSEIESDFREAETEAEARKREAAVAEQAVESKKGRYASALVVSSVELRRTSVEQLRKACALTPQASECGHPAGGSGQFLEVEITAFEISGLKLGARPTSNWRIFVNDDRVECRVNGTPRSSLPKVDFRPGKYRFYKGRVVYIIP